MNLFNYLGGVEPIASLTEKVEVPQCSYAIESLVSVHHIERQRDVMKEEIRHRQELVHFGKLLHEHGYVAATDGNLSVRLDGQSVIITPTCISKGMMRPQDLIVVDMDGHTLAGRRGVSSEVAMHLLIYKMRSDVNAVVHAHPPVATGYAAAGIPLNPAIVCEAVIGLGAVPLAPYATPGTSALADVLRPLIPEHQAILMANHGAVTYAEDLLRAYLKMELVEHFARISLVTKLLGHEQLLTAHEIENLNIKRCNAALGDFICERRTYDRSSQTKRNFSPHRTESS